MRVKSLRQLYLQNRNGLVLAVVWLLVVGVGLARVWRYDGTAGAAAEAPAAWSGASSLPHRAGTATLVMVIHPHCPCSRASLKELNRLLALCPGRVTADVVFVQYAGMSDAWEHSDTWHQAAALPGVHVLRDPGGTLAQQLGARTSGQTYVFAPSGRLLFSGGLTGARGHEGDNASLSAAVALLREDATAPAHAPVFGCPLFNETKNGDLCRTIPHL